MPRPGTPVIPVKWEAHHQPTANGQLTATCDLLRPSAGVFGETAGKTVYPPATILHTDQPCRIQASQRLNNDLTVGDAQITLHRYMVALLVEVTDLRINDELKVTECSDATMVGRVLRIVDIPSGSLMWQRDLVCTDTTPATR